MIPVALACAAAGIIVGVVNMGIGGMIAEIVETLSMGNIYLLLIITALASLLLGMGLPTTATYIVMASLTAPIIVQVGGYYDPARDTGPSVPIGRSIDNDQVYVLDRRLQLVPEGVVGELCIGGIGRIAGG